MAAKISATACVLGSMSRVSAKGGWSRRHAVIPRLGHTRIPSHARAHRLSGVCDVGLFVTQLRLRHAVVDVLRLTQNGCLLSVQSLQPGAAQVHGRVHPGQGHLVSSSTPSCGTLED